MLLQPSLSRRLLVAQMVLLVLLWLALLGLLILDEMGDESDLHNEAQFALLLGAAPQPELLRRIEAYEKTLESIDNEPLLRNHFIVRRAADGAVLSSSPGAPLGVATAADGVVRLVEVDGMRWRARTLGGDGATATLVSPADVRRVVMRVSSGGYFILPLLVSLPFLVLPAWLSVRLALRPWRKVSDEIASRGPHDLRPLAAADSHRELQPLLHAVNALMAKLRQAHERERSFIADSAHELRTPVAAIRINAEALLQREAHGDDNRALLDAIVKASERAGRLVRQLLALMRSESAACAGGSAPLRLEELVQDRIAVLAPLAAARQLDVTLDADAAVGVSGDEQTLCSLVDNLLENAFKYSPTGGRVHVAVRRDGGQAQLTVGDEGPGIAPELRERVFDRFYRVPGQLVPGSGLGLAIVRSAIDHLGGEVWLTGHDGGRGLRVTVRMPLAAA